MDDFKKINEAAITRLVSFIKENLQLDIDLVTNESKDIELLEATAFSELTGVKGEVILTIDSFFASHFLKFLGLPAKEPIDDEYKDEAAKEFLNIVLGNVIRKIKVNKTLDFKAIKNIDKLNIKTSTTFIFDKVHSGEGVLKLIFIEKGNE